MHAIADFLRLLDRDFDEVIAALALRGRNYVFHRAFPDRRRNCGLVILSSEAEKDFIRNQHENRERGVVKHKQKISEEIVEMYA